MPWRITALLVLCGAAVTAAPESVLGHAGYLCCFLLIVVAGWQAVRLGARAARRPLGLIAAAMTSWLAHLAAHDELTGLANRRTLVHTLEREFRPGGDTMLLYLDLNLFKCINDQYGHAAGDAVLVEVGRRLQAGVRPGDLVARLGGDEFAVLCHRMDAVGARRLTDRLTAAVCRPIRCGEHSFAVGASVGHAGAYACRTADDLVSAADEAMLTAKRRWHDSRRAAGSVPGGRLRSG